MAPTPGGVIRELAKTGSGGTKLKMLERLHLDYKQLCSFAHELQAANMAKTVYDTHSPERRMFSEADIDKNFQQNVNTSARVFSLMAIAQSTAELTALYPNDMDLVSSTVNA